MCLIDENGYPFPMPVNYAFLCALAWACLSMPARAQMQASPFQPARQIDEEQFNLPWDGAGAAVFNPALLTETRRVDVRAAFFHTASGKSGTDFYQGAVRIYRDLSAGLAWFSNSAAVDGSNALYVESILTPMLAYGLDSLAGSGYSLSLGAAVPRHAFDAFGAVKSHTYSLNLGAHLTWPSLGMAGRFHTGLGVRNLFSQGIQLPEDFGAKYNGLRPNYDLSVLWGSIFGCVDLYQEYNLHVHPDRSVAPFDDHVPFVKSLGAEYRPIPALGVRVERTWLKTWTAGLVLQVPVKAAVIGAEADFSHEKIFAAQDEGRGFLWSLALNAGF